MGNDRERKDSEKDECKTGSRSAAENTSMVTIIGRNDEQQQKEEQQQKKEQQQPAQTEDAARLRLMEISQAVPQADEVELNNEHLSQRASASPRRPDSEDEIRRKLMSISYSDVDKPLSISARPGAV